MESNLYLNFNINIVYYFRKCLRVTVFAICRALFIFFGDTEITIFLFSTFQDVIKLDFRVHKMVSFDYQYMLQGKL